MAEKLQRTHASHEAESASPQVEAQTAAPEFANEFMNEALLAPRARTLLSLQNTLGNQAVQRALAAARTASRSDNDLAQRIQVASSGGGTLDASTRERLQAGLGVDLSSVRVHLDDEADRLSESVEAIAFTTGNDIFFRKGMYRPDTAVGLRLLAHEVTHTIQQSSGPVEGTPNAGGVSISDPADQFEQAADRAANQAIAGNTVTSWNAAVSHSNSVVTAVQREEEDDSIVKKIKESYSSAKEAGELFGPKNPLEKFPSLERADKGLSPFLPRGLPMEGMIAPGSAQHFSENLNAKGAGNFLWSMGMPLLSDIERGKGLGEIGQHASENLGGYTGSLVEGDMLKTSGLGGVGQFGSKVGALNAVAKLAGVPEDFTGAVDIATTPLSPVSATLKEGAGSWYSMLQSGASALAGDKDWDKPMMEHYEKGITTASPFQSLYWLGELASGGGDKLSERLIGKEGQSGKMGSLVEAGNYWGDTLAEKGKFSKDMSEIGSFMWEGASGKGGIKGAWNTGKEAVSEAGGYWKNVITGKGNLAGDLGEIWDYAKENVTTEKVLGGAQSAAEGITRTVGGEKLVGLTREAGNYWGDVMSEEGKFSKDMSEMGSFLWEGATGKGGIKGAAKGALNTAKNAWDYLTSW